MKSLLSQINWPQLWGWLDKISSMIGLGTFLFSILIWFKVRSQQKKIKSLVSSLTPVTDYNLFYEKYKKTGSSLNPAALCISLLKNTGSIKKTVEEFLQNNKLKVKTIEEIEMDGINNQQDIETYIQRLREMRKGPLSEASELCLFIAGPVQAGTIAGAVLDNWIPVLLYHKGKETYEYWGPLVKH